MVQNRVDAGACRSCRRAVQTQGITIRKQTPDILMIVNFFSPDGRYDDIYLSNFATIHVRDELLRVDGVSDINVLGQRDYSIRALARPAEAGAACNMTAMDVAAAIRAQNVEAAAGPVGQPPRRGDLGFQLPLDTLGRLSDPEQFGDIIVKVARRPAVAGLDSDDRGGSELTVQPTIPAVQWRAAGGAFSGGAATNTGVGTSFNGDAGGTRPINPNSTISSPAASRFIRRRCRRRSAIPRVRRRR